ncbi:MAG: carbohydrate kinase, partial [Clostridia bacterium]|nr:carbohydrate kinase [Clostridia bacterium]
GKSEMIRSVLEGVCFHMRWFLEAQDKKIKTAKTLRFVGGGALSALTCQILADVTGRTVETVNSPQNVGAVGAAVTVAVGLGMIQGFADAKKMIPASQTYQPNPANKAVYDKNYAVYKNLYKANKANFAALNG